MSLLDALRNAVQRRRNAYRTLFRPGGQPTVAAEDVLNDLRKFCRATSTPAQVAANGSVDPIATGMAIGRLEVWHRIASNLHLSDADLYRLVERNVQDGTD